MCSIPEVYWVLDHSPRFRLTRSEVRVPGSPGRKTGTENP